MAFGLKSSVVTPIAIVGGALAVGIIIYALIVGRGQAPDPDGVTITDAQGAITAEGQVPDAAPQPDADQDADAEQVNADGETSDGPVIDENAGQVAENATPSGDQDASANETSQEDSGEVADAPSESDQNVSDVVSAETDGGIEQSSASQADTGEAAANDPAMDAEAPGSNVDTAIEAARSGETDAAPAAETESPAVDETQENFATEGSDPDAPSESGETLRAETSNAGQGDVAEQAPVVGTVEQPAPVEEDDTATQDTPGSEVATEEIVNESDNAGAGDQDPVQVSGDEADGAVEPGVVAEQPSDQPTPDSETSVELTQDDSPSQPDTSVVLSVPPSADPDAPAIGTPDAPSVAPDTDLALLDRPAVAGSTVRATIEPGSQSAEPPQAAEQSGDQPQAIVLAPSAPGQAASAAPEFDLVRVDKSGSTVIAGRAEPNTTVDVLQNGKVVASVTASGRGEFVALFNSEISEQAQSIELASRSQDGGPEVFSESSVIVLGRTLPEIDEASNEIEPVLPPAVIKASAEAVTVLQPVIGLADLDNISLDSISYDGLGEVVLAGRGRPDRIARAYVDDQVKGEAAISANGSWRIKLIGLEAGRYVLRIDEVGQDGSVTSRVESPFQRVYPSAENLEALLAERQVVIQRGDNLWNIARVRFGDGFKYTVIYDANTDQIRDPDLIYPGQIFDVPNSETGRDDE